LRTTSASGPVVTTRTIPQLSCLAVEVWAPSSTFGFQSLEKGY